MLRKFFWPSRFIACDPQLLSTARYANDFLSAYACTRNRSGNSHPHWTQMPPCTLAGCRAQQQSLRRFRHCNKPTDLRADLPSKDSFIKIWWEQRLWNGIRNCAGDSFGFRAVKVLDLLCLASAESRKAKSFTAFFDDDLGQWGRLLRSSACFWPLDKCNFFGRPRLSRPPLLESNGGHRALVDFPMESCARSREVSGSRS